MEDRSLMADRADGAAPADRNDGPLPAERVGDRLLAGRYRIEQHIGRGGMSEVHLGTDLRLGRRVAIKLLKSSLANDPVFRMRFRQEAHAASRMTHPTIVRVFDAGEETVLESGGGEAQLPFIVMEHVEGRLLKDLVDEGPMTAAEAAHVVSGILTALEYSHREGVVHRDIKPANVMITSAGQVKVMDFGIARAISDSSATVAQTTAILGTASYFSPEQAKGETVDARSDLYSTGVLLFELLTGRVPFRGDSPVAVAYQHVSEQPDAPSALNPRVTKELDAVVLRALDKDKETRYQSASEFREDVEAVLAGRQPAARLPRRRDEPDLFTGEAVTTETTVRQMAFDDRTTVGTAGRPPVAWLWAGIACVIVVVLAVAIWVASLATEGFGANARTVPPGLVGSTQTTAQAALTRLDLRPEVRGIASDEVAEGSVVRAEPAAGTALDRGDRVVLFVSTGSATVAVPALAGLKVEAAKTAIEQAGLEVGAVTVEHDVDTAKDAVVSASPATGQPVAPGTRVALVVSDGLVALPDLVGETIPDAQAALEELDLQSRVSPTGDCGAFGDVVVAQSLPAGDVEQKTLVELSYCDGTTTTAEAPTETSAPEPTATEPDED